MERIDLFKSHLSEKKAVKIIAGIDNFDFDKVKQVVTAAEKSGASAVDIAFDENLIAIVKGMTSLPVFVSSIEPKDLAKAVELGADAIEVGNFDILYKAGKRFSAQDVLDIVNQTLTYLDGQKTFMCVTVPGHISVSEQIQLAHELETLGIDLIQTEGAATVQAQSAGARGLLETAQVSISNTIELSRNTSIPIMTASGISSTTAPIAFASGASAIGVGSAINKLSTSIEMIAAARSIVEAIQTSKTVELV